MLNAPVMSKLISMMGGGSKAVSDNLFKIFPAIPTKFTAYNIYSGNLRMSIHGYPVLNGGAFPRLCNIIGQSATGKSAVAVGLLTSAVDYVWHRYGEGYANLDFFDVEDHTDDNRFCNVAGWTKFDWSTKCRHYPGDLSLVNLFNHILTIADYKMKYKKDFLIPSGLRDVDGSEVLFMAPTFILVDSVAQINTSGIEEILQHDKAGDVKLLNQLASNMNGATDAKEWTIFVKMIKPWLDKGNIGLYFINHKTKEIQTNMFQVPTRRLPFLLPGEKLKGGEELIYQSYNIFDLASGEKFNEKNPVYGPHVNGFAARASFVKNKNNIEGAQFPMVFDQFKGYLAEISDFEYLYQKKYGIDGSVKIKLDVLPEIEFTRRQLWETIQEYPQLGRAIQFTTKFHASSVMLNNQPVVPSLKDFGTNLPLAQRLSVIYNFTNPQRKEEPTDEFEGFFRLAHENRHYWDFGNCDLKANNIILDGSNIEAASHGYNIIPNTGVTPFDVELGTAEMINGKYIKPKNIISNKQ